MGPARERGSSGRAIQGHREQQVHSGCGLRRGYVLHEEQDDTLAQNMHCTYRTALKTRTFGCAQLGASASFFNSVLKHGVPTRFSGFGPVIIRSLRPV